MIRMSYPELMKATAFKDQKTKKDKGDPKYKLEMLVDPATYPKFWVKNDEKAFVACDIKEVLKEMVAEMWPGKALKELFPLNKKGIRAGWPLKDGDKLAAYNEENKKTGDHYKGMTAISCQAAEEYPPKLYHRVSGKAVELKRDDDADMAKARKMFQAGNYGVVEATIVAIEVDEKFFLTFYINGIVFTKEGTPIGSGSMGDRFDGVMGGETDEYDPTGDGFGSDVDDI
jgi:hypothetical protein